MVEAMEAMTRSRPVTHRAAPRTTGGVSIRRIRRSDIPELERFYAGLSDESRRTRFFASGGRDLRYLTHPKTHGCLVDGTCDFFR